MENCTCGHTGDEICTCVPELVIEFGLEVDPSTMERGRVDGYILPSPRGLQENQANIFAKSTEPSWKSPGWSARDGILFTLKVPDLKIKDVVYVMAGRSNTVEPNKYKKSVVEFDEKVYLTEIMTAEIYVFKVTFINVKEQKSEEVYERLTWNEEKNRNEEKKLSYKEVSEMKLDPGTNRILISLSDNGTKIWSCIIDGVTHVEKGIVLVKTARGTS